MKDVHIGCSGWAYASWRRRSAAWRSRREVFAYLKNDWEEFAPPDAMQLREGLSAAQPV